MALIKTVTDRANQISEYHKIALESVRFAESATPGKLVCRYQVLVYKDKASRDNVAPVYDSTDSYYVSMEIDDIRADKASFDGMYNLLKKNKDKHDFEVDTTDG